MYEDSVIRQELVVAYSLRATKKLYIKKEQFYHIKSIYQNLVVSSCNDNDGKVYVMWLFISFYPPSLDTSTIKKMLYFVILLNYNLLFIDTLTQIGWTSTLHLLRVVKDIQIWLFFMNMKFHEIA